MILKKNAPQKVGTRIIDFIINLFRFYFLYIYMPVLKDQNLFLKLFEKNNNT